VEVTGNEAITTDMLQDFLQNQGIHYGMWLNRIPLEELKTSLRQEYEEITWVSASIEGTKLWIRLKENDAPASASETVSATNLVAEETGVVQSILVRRGTALVKAGDEVAAGDILIEGKVTILNEEGEVKQEEYCQADGDVWLMYDIPVEEKIKFTYEYRVYTGEERKRYVLAWGETYWAFFAGKIPFEHYDLLEERTRLSIFGRIPLPMALSTRSYREYAVKEGKYSEAQARQLLNQQFQKIITGLEEKGVQIIEKNVKIVSNSVFMSLTGTISVSELCKKHEQLED
jgi:similar to stage IV sporulation protein